MILYVEDNHMSAVRFFAAASHIGIEEHVCRVLDGEQARLFLRKCGPFSHARTPTTIIMNMHLPPEDGRAVLEELAAEDVLASVPVQVFDIRALKFERLAEVVGLASRTLAVCEQAA